MKLLTQLIFVLLSYEIANWSKRCKKKERHRKQDRRNWKIKKPTEGNKLKIFEILTRRKIIVIQKTKTFIFVRLWNKFNILIFHPLHPSYRTESALFLHWSVYAAVAWVYYTAQYPISVLGKINQFVFSLSVLKYKLLPTVLAQL